jgi:hypothetical protein
MNKNKFTPNEMLADTAMNQVIGGGLVTDVMGAYTTAKGTPVTTSGTIAKPTSVRGDELIAKTISTVSTVGTIAGATVQNTYIATSVALAALPYFR